MTDYVDIDFDRVITETAIATLFKIEEREVWIPNRVIDGIYDPEHHIQRDIGMVSVAEWFALKEGLI